MNTSPFVHAIRIQLTGLCVAVLWAAGAGAAAQEVMPLWADAPPHENGLTGPERASGCTGNITQPTLTVYRPATDVAIDAAILVVPGGGYSVVCLGHEGDAVAEWLTGIGLTVGVLKYRLPNQQHEVPLEDAQQAQRMMRSAAPSWNVSPDKIGIMGFSAGGHLTSTIGTHFDEDFSAGKGDRLGISHRPDFMVLVYPVISMMEDVTHQGSRTGLLGEQPAPSMVQKFSNHLQVGPDTPPTFLVHAGDDDVVHVDNSTAFYTALKASSVPAEFHVFERGGHGFATRADSPAYAWMSLFEDWLAHILDPEN